MLERVQISCLKAKSNNTLVYISIQKKLWIFKLIKKFVTGIRTVLLESENHQCPDCKEIGISPDTMIPNRYLRKSVDNFRNTTGYQRTLPSRTLMMTQPPPGNSLVQVPLIQPVMAQQPILTLGTRPSRPLEVINLVESRSDTDSPIHIDNHKSSSNHILPLHKTPSIAKTKPVLTSKGADISRGHPQDSSRMQYSQS